MIAKTQTNTLRNTVSGVIAAVILVGCASAIASPRDNKAALVARAQQFIAEGHADRAIPVVERAVSADPRDAALRMLLGQSYLRSGRFASATAAFNDAMTLGENSSRTALSLALAQAGQGNAREAVGVLDDWRDAIPASDYGLALALSGEATRGVAVLSDAIRAGENTPKMRQNLAYAYALDGRWREARMMAQQDVPADQVGDRLTQWAANGRPEAFQQRVAALLGAPVRSDPGQPQALALNNTPSAEQLAAEAGAVPSMQRSEAALAEAELPPVQQRNAPALAMATTAPVELAPVQPRNTQETVYTPPSYVPPPAPVAEQAYVPPVYTPVAAQAYVEPQAAHHSQPAVQPHAARSQVAPARPLGRVQTAATPAVRAQAPARLAAAAVPARATSGGTHLVQLGSFSTQQGARRAWGIYTAQNPQLRSFRMSITQANVRGRNYWRVAAAGFDASSANGYCGSLRRRGGACFAYAMPSATPGRVTPNQQQRQASGLQMARRR
jgi:Flp pilus assembly protein TadD